MSSLPPLLHLLCQEVLHDEGYGHMWGNSDVEGEVSHPKVSKPFPLDGLAHNVEDVLVREVSLSIGLHLLQLGLGVVEGKTGEG